MLLERGRQPVGAGFGSRERDRRVDAVVFEQLHQQIGLLFLGHGIERLAERLNRSGLRGELYAYRIAENLAHEAGDLRRQRCREEERLALRRHLRDNAPNVGEKSHVEHAVGFVEDEHLDIVEPRSSLL